MQNPLESHFSFLSNSAIYPIIDLFTKHKRRQLLAAQKRNQPFIGSRNLLTFILLMVLHHYLSRLLEEDSLQLVRSQSRELPWDYVKKGKRERGAFCMSLTMPSNRLPQTARPL
ncbi:hypothetical protein AVEN_62417-1 [Araneus ventricosus]|uniref:Uncharacterized protein n=1 Tax=Araneus ventricosus TaxID=182803 RepID=A0A4Y2IJ98_ARAVE|nr:hypothetical protein AVEN_62417-1 [Araneus ventricosus]